MSIAIDATTTTALSSQIARSRVSAQRTTIGTTATKK